MDKNTVIGFVLIALILIGFSVLNRPSEEDIARQKRYTDSIATVQQQRIEAEEALRVAAELVADSLSANSDSISTAKIEGAYAQFSPSAVGQETFYVLENELVKLTISNKGARIYSAELKNYKTHDSLPLILFDAEESTMAFTFATNNNRVISSTDLYFEPATEITSDPNGNQTLLLRLKTTDADSYLDVAYTLPANDFMVGFGLKAKNMNNIMPAGTNFLEMAWASKIRQQEKGRSFEERYSQIMYKFTGNDVDKLSESKDDQKSENSRIKWIAYKDQFFSSVLIADDWFQDTRMVSKFESESTLYIKSYASSMAVPFDPTGNTPTNFRMYFGPNQYKVLNDYDVGVDKDSKLYLRNLVPLGWGVFGWVNRFLIIPIFNVLSLFIRNFGIILLILTVIIKLIIMPMTYKSYLSTAKMRVLKPQIDEINAKIPADKPQERQKATMSLYSKMGVSPMSGCLPMLLQMPFLIAMFSFIPSAFELRQQSFLWANDLSSYDAILSWNAHIPLISTYFGNHISGFCLLMTITTLISTKLNGSTQQQMDQPGMGMMKWMMYFMPIMLLFIFNSYASGLSYYYFLSTLISIVTTYLFRAFVDEKKLLAQLHAKSNAKNNGKKKMSFMERVEKMQKEQEKALKSKKK